MSSDPFKKWVTDRANGRRRSERCGLPPTSLSVPSCKAGVSALCRLKTMGTGDERAIPEQWVVRGPTSRWVICLFCLVGL